jgi:hypothetical protein
MQSISASMGGLSSKCMVGIGERGVTHDVELLFMFSV